MIWSKIWLWGGRMWYRCQKVIGKRWPRNRVAKTWRHLHGCWSHLRCWKSLGRKRGLPSRGQSVQRMKSWEHVNGILTVSRKRDLIWVNDVSFKEAVLFLFLYFQKNKRPNGLEMMVESGTGVTEMTTKATGIGEKKTSLFWEGFWKNVIRKELACRQSVYRKVPRRWRRCWSCWG